MGTQEGHRRAIAFIQISHLPRLSLKQRVKDIQPRSASTADIQYKRLLPYIQTRIRKQLLAIG